MLAVVIRDGQQQAGGVDGDVPFPAVDLLARVEPAAVPGHGLGGLDRLGVDDRGGRLRRAAGRDPALAAQFAGCTFPDMPVEFLTDDEAAAYGRLRGRAVVGPATSD